MMKIRVFTLLLASVFLRTGTVAANIDPDFRTGTLPNGLTYYIRHNENPAGVADYFFAQRVGSVNEDENQRGLAHFLEQMCFNGTRNVPGNSLIA